MTKFINFICQNTMIIINTDDISCMHFCKEYKTIMLCLKNYDLKNNFPYIDEQDFKIQCDEIMRQLDELND